MPPPTPFQFRKIRTPEDMLGAFVCTEDTAGVSQDFGSVLQRGIYTLNTGKAFVTLPRLLISAASAANIAILITSKTATHQYVESVAVASAMGSALISTMSGFTVSGSGSDTGYWMVLGYR